MGKMASVSNLISLSVQAVRCMNFVCPSFVPNVMFYRFPATSISTRSFCLASAACLTSCQLESLKGGIEPFLSCSMPHARLRIAVLLSGGVDSSVALRLLQAAGHSCTAYYLKIWFQDDFENFWQQCPWEEDLKYAKAVCEQAGLSLEVVHLTDEYWKNVVSYVIEEYRSGRTPNTDVLCNSRIKFGAFLEAIGNLGFDYIASGHYARIIHLGPDKPSMLQLSEDVVKDQTYFLSHLSQMQLKKLIFPLGSIAKDEVRKLASTFELPNKERKDSQGICFLGKIKFDDFIARHIGEMVGIILEAETGNYLGQHRGFWFYTIGQRHGLRLPGGPWYVVLKDVKNNVVFVSRNYFSTEKSRRFFRVGSLKWISGSPPDSNDLLRCKVRHAPGFYDCNLTVQRDENDDEDVASVAIPEDDQGLASGQTAVFYRGKECVGSGVILDPLTDCASLPVCEKALAVAAMEDKSKLGKPIRIKARVKESSRDVGAGKVVGKLPAYNFCLPNYGVGVFR